MTPAEAPPHALRCCESTSISLPRSAGTPHRSWGTFTGFASLHAVVEEPKQDAMATEVDLRQVCCRQIIPCDCRQYVAKKNKI